MRYKQSVRLPAAIDHRPAADHIAAAGSEALPRGVDGLRLTQSQQVWLARGERLGRCWRQLTGGLYHFTRYLSTRWTCSKVRAVR